MQYLVRIFIVFSISAALVDLFPRDAFIEELQNESCNETNPKLLVKEKRMCKCTPEEFSLLLLLVDPAEKLIGTLLKNGEILVPAALAYNMGFEDFFKAVNGKEDVYDVNLRRSEYEFVKLLALPDEISCSCENSADQIKIEEKYYKNSMLQEYKRTMNRAKGLSVRLIGCPTVICYDGNVDAVSKMKEMIYVFREGYYWEINGAKSVSFSYAKMYEFENEMPVRMDAAWSNNGQSYAIVNSVIFRETPIIGLDRKSFTKYVKADDSLNKTVAAFTFNGDSYLLCDDDANHESLTIRKVKVIKKWRVESEAELAQKNKGEKEITEYPPLQEYIFHQVEEVKTVSVPEIPDAALVYHDEDLLYLIVGWKYATIPAATFLEEGADKLNWRFTFLEFLRCDSRNYTTDYSVQQFGSKSYLEFLHLYDDSNEIKSPGPVYTIPLVISALAIVMQVFILIVVGAFWHRYRKATEQGLISMVKTYREKGKEGNRQRLSKIASSKLDLKQSDDSKSLRSNRSRLSNLGSVGKSLVEIGTRKANKKK